MSSICIHQSAVKAGDKNIPHCLLGGWLKQEPVKTDLKTKSTESGFVLIDSVLAISF